jgi:hypothetical protein
MRFQFLASALIGLTISCTPTFGCSCVSPPPDVRTAEGLAKWTASHGDAIFEGKVESAEWKWHLLDAKVGDLTSPDLDQDPPFMQVSFEVSRTYRGAQRENIQIRTGLGGGDCGFPFEIGKQYLVYAFADESGQLSTGICSGTALLQESHANLSYLRGEQIAPGEVERNTPTATGKLCGQVVRTGLDFTDSRILLFRVGNISPMPSDEGEPEQDGSFCLTRVIPGTYHLLFLNGDEGSPTSFVFFAGVAKSSEATAVDVTSGDTDPKLIFNIPPQPTFSVSGTVLVPSRSAMPAECKVLLLSVDPRSFLLAYAQEVSPSGHFDFPQVLPGKYWAFVTVDSEAASKWLTRKAEVDVEASAANLLLELISK